MSITFRLASVGPGLAFVVTIAACAQPAAQVAPATGPAGHRRQGPRPRRHRVERVHRPPRGGPPRRRPPARLGPRRGGPASPKAPSCSAATCCSRSTRGRSRPRSIACAPTWPAPGPPSTRATAESDRAQPAVGRERDLRRGARPSLVVGRRGRGAGVGGGGGAARRRTEPRVHAGRRAHHRPRRPRHRHRGQPGVERTRRGDAADDAGVDSIRFTPRSRWTSSRFSPSNARPPAPAEARRRRAGPTSAWRWPAKRTFRATDACSSSTTSSTPPPARSASARSSPTPTAR